MALTCIASRIPVRLPAAGTWATRRILRMVHIAGAYLLVSRVLPSTETPIMGLMVAMV